MSTFRKLHSHIEMGLTKYTEYFTGLFGAQTICREVPYSVVVWC